MTTSIEIWSIYGQRDDTDAVVIRHLERKLSEEERERAATNRENRRLREAIAASGFRFVDRYGEPAHLEGVIVEEQA